MKSTWIDEEAYVKILSKLTAADRWLVRLLRATGFRVEDILNTRCWQWNGDSIEIRERKTGNTRRVTITPEIRRIVEQYRGCIKRYHPLYYFVPTRRGRVGDKRKLHRTTIWRNFKKAVKKAGYKDRGYTIHSLRKCYAVDKLRKTGSFESVQADMGHRYLSTTLIYLQDALTLK